MKKRHHILAKKILAIEIYVTCRHILLHCIVLFLCVYNNCFRSLLSSFVRTYAEKIVLKLRSFETSEPFVINALLTILPLMTYSVPLYYLVLFVFFDIRK